VVEGINNATLEGKIDGEVYVARVMWSLMSGLRITSIVGNGWNAGITNGIVKERVKRWTGKEINHVAVQGDDTHLIHKQWAVLMLCKMIYDAVGAESAESKFKIGTNGGYLRRIFERPTFSSGGRTVGYLARAVTSWTQRKPWSDEPWTPFNQLKSQWEALATMKQRGADGKILDAMWDAVTDNWSKSSGIDKRWLNAPTVYGGAGLGDWEGWVPSSKLPVVALPPDVLPQSVDGAPLLKRSWGLKGFALTDEEAQQLSNGRFSKLVGASRLPAVDRILRDMFNEAKDKAHVQWMHTRSPNVSCTFLDPGTTPATFKLWGNRISTTFGSRPDVAADWAMAKELAAVRAVSAMSVLKEMKPAIALWVKSQIRKGVCVGDVIDWYAGSLPGCNMNLTSGRMRSWALNLTAYNIKKPTKKNFKTVCSRIFAQASGFVVQSELGRRVGGG